MNVTSSFTSIQSRISEFLPEMVALRRDIHRHPELGYQEQRTSDIVANLLAEWGYSVDRGLGGTGVVGTLKRGDGSATIGIRADMDALPITETADHDYVSTNPGVMHACGHDGHTTTLLTAARYLAQHGEFNGTLHVIFQPAEESLGGGLKMIEDGLFERFPCDAVFGLHNIPGIPVGKMNFIAGPGMASSDTAIVRIIGRGGHGAVPHLSVDPIAATGSLITALQTVVSRNVPPLEAAVVTIGSIHGGSTSNIIPDSVEMELTIRAFSAEVRELLQERITTLCQQQAQSFGATAEVDYQRGYPVLVNDEEQTAFAQQLAIELFGESNVATSDPITASEDFAYMLEKVPGSYLFVGNGDSASLHNPGYVFNDQNIGTGAIYWAALVERYLKRS